MIDYHKPQKSSERKVWQLTGFYPNVRKTFATFALSVLKLLTLLKAFKEKTFAIH